MIDLPILVRFKTRADCSPASDARHPTYHTRRLTPRV
jgi:hypothetical protein